MPTNFTETYPYPSLGLGAVRTVGMAGATATQTGLRPSVGLSAASTVLGLETPASAPPTGLREAVLQRVSELYPAPTLVNGIPAQPWTPTSVYRADAGVLHVFVDGVDRTYVRGARVEVSDYQLMDPFGCGPAHFVWPGISAWDVLGAGTFAWLHAGASVDLKLIPAAGYTGSTIWSGVMTGFTPDGSSTGNTGLGVECVGDLAAGAMLESHKPRQYVPLTDRGVLIARALNEEVYSRHIAPVPTTTTGHATRERGSGDQTVQEYVQTILPAGWTVARVAPRVYRVQARSPRSTWTVRLGQRGVQCRVGLDYTQAPNVIYGRGVNGDGYAWANWYYPGQDGTSQPPFPMASAGTAMTLGLTDAGTTTGRGVSDLQRRINELNVTADVAVTGTYDAATQAAVRSIQGHAGIAVDGAVAGQTWNALYPLYTSDQLDQAIRLPLVVDSRVQPVLYGGDGTVLGANPNFQAGILRVERDEQMGSGISKATGIASATDEWGRTRLAGEAYPGYVGTIVLEVDPNEDVRWNIREMDRIVVQGLGGRNPSLHIGQVQSNPSNGAGTVTLTVDELQRDLPTIQAVIHQDQDSKDDPLRMPGRRARRSQTTPDAVEPFDGESRAGIIPRIPLYAGLWTVQAIPVSAAGRIARITMSTSPACEFYIALFGDRVTAAELIKYVGDPTSTDGYGRGPYQVNQDKLVKDLAYIEGIGGPYQPAGYSPGQYTSPWDGSSSPMTGRLESTAPINYRSVRPPWIWVAFYASASCYVSGRILPGPIEG